MSTLTYSHDTVIGAGSSAADDAGRKPRRSFWRRVYDAMVAAQQRRAEREIVAYLATRGGLFTDETEREIMQRLTGNRSRSV